MAPQLFHNAIADSLLMIAHLYRQRLRPLIRTAYPILRLSCTYELNPLEEETPCFPKMRATRLASGGLDLEVVEVGLAVTHQDVEDG